MNFGLMQEKSRIVLEKSINGWWHKLRTELHWKLLMHLRETYWVTELQKMENRIEIANKCKLCLIKYIMKCIQKL